MTRNSMGMDYGIIDAKTVASWADEADVVIVG